MNRNSRADPVVTATNSDSSFNIGISKNLYNKHSGHLVRGTLAGNTSFDRVGNLIVPHHIGSSTIMEASVAKPLAMPLGKSSALGKAVLHILRLHVTKLCCALLC